MPWPPALRAEGGLVGDAAIIDMVEALHLDAVGAGPLEPLLRRPGRHRRAGQRPSASVRRRRRWPAAEPGQVPRRRSGTSSGPATGRAVRAGGSMTRRHSSTSGFATGTRFHAVLAPLASPGTCLSLRVPTRRRLTLEQLIASQMVGCRDRPAAARLRRGQGRLRDLRWYRYGQDHLAGSLAVPRRPRRSASSSSRMRPNSARIIRTWCRSKHVRPMSRALGEVTLRQLVRQALRMRPDRLVVGEVRGAEVVDMLAALNTGHEGGCGTIHANSADGCSGPVRGARCCSRS